MVTRFKDLQRFRAIIGKEASFFTTARAIRAGVGDFTNCNTALRLALDTLEVNRSDISQEATDAGIGGTWAGLSVQLTTIE